MKKELKQSVLDQFWSIYDTEGTIQALSWLESLKYNDNGILIGLGSGIS